MKEISKYSRLAMYLEKLYDRLNEDFFSGSWNGLSSPSSLPQEPTGTTPCTMHGV
jgi:hypothetical protein